MDKKQKKKLKRTAKKKKEKKVAADQQQRLARQMSMFDRLPEECSACKKEFPRTREAHMTWKVTIRHEQELVRLFCPECQQVAQQMKEAAQ